MGSMSDTGTIGQWMAHARKLRGLSQAELAQPATPSLIAAVAHALNVNMTELTGQPYRGTTARSDRIREAVPEIRQAIAQWDVPPELDVPPRPLDELEIELERAGVLRMEASYVQLVYLAGNGAAECKQRSSH
jgi:hypothetical protein